MLRMLPAQHYHELPSGGPLMALGREVDRTNHGGGHSGERDEGEQLDKKSRGTTSTRQKAMTRFGRSLTCSKYEED